MSEKHHDYETYLLNSIIEDSSDIIIIISTDNKVIAFNKSALDFFNQNKEEVHNKDYLYLCDYLKLPAQFKSLLGSKEQIEFQNYVWSNTIFKTQNSELHHLLFGKINAKNSFQHENFLLKSIIASIPGSIYWKDTNGTYLGCNDFMIKVAGFLSKTDIIGKTDQELWPNQARTFTKTDQEVMTLKCAQSLEERVDLPNGKTRFFTVEKIPLFDDKQNVIGILGNSLEITELKKTQADLMTAKSAAEAGEKAKAEFIANVSHDMRTPLSGIISISHELEEDNITKDRRKELSTELAESADALLDMFVEILEDVAAEHMTENDIAIETFDINRLVDRLVKLEKPSLTQKGLKFLTHIDPDIPQYLVSDRRKIHRIVLNLIGNAVKFTKQGHIELKIQLLEKQNDPRQVTLKFNVIDTGIGVPETSKTHLFERFYKASPSYQTEYKGFGLGLHIAKTYTHLLGGTISFESKEGIGSNFYAIITLQIANESEIGKYNKNRSNKPSVLKINTGMNSDSTTKKITQTPVKDIETQSLPNTPTILIIEDNLILRRSTARLVKKHHLNIMDVEDGKPALELAKTQHFDLILSDVGLIEMSGIEFTQKLRAFEQEHHIAPVPIIGVTAHAAHGSDECLNAGMNAVIPKPLTPELLAEIFQKFLPAYK